MSSLTIPLYISIIDEKDHYYWAFDGQESFAVAKSAVKTARKIAGDDWELEISRSYAKKKGWI